MRSLLVAGIAIVVGVAGCKKETSTPRPGASLSTTDQDALWALAPDGARIGLLAEMKKHFTEKQIVELTVFCGMWNYSNRLCEALHVDLERPDKRIEFQK